MYHVFSIRSSVSTHPGGFLVLDIVSSAAVNIGVHVYFQVMVFCGYMSRDGIVRPYGIHFHFSLSCIGEGNGNPLQCSYLENLRDGGAWWAAVYGVAQSRTRLKQLSSSSNSSSMLFSIVAAPIYIPINSVQFSSVQLLSRVQLFATP